MLWLKTWQNQVFGDKCFLRELSTLINTNHWKSGVFFCLFGWIFVSCFVVGFFFFFFQKMKIPTGNPWRFWNFWWERNLCGESRGGAELPDWGGRDITVEATSYMRLSQLTECRFLSDSWDAFACVPMDCKLLVIATAQRCNVHSIKKQVNLHNKLSLC